MTITGEQGMTVNWRWMRRAELCKLGVPSGMLTAWAANGDIRCKKNGGERQAATFFNADDVQEMLDRLPDVPTKPGATGRFAVKI